MATKMRAGASDRQGMSPLYRKAGAERGRQQDVGRDELIVAATLALLGELGYDALTMSEVAVRAGVSKATLYRRWAAKPELVADAVSTIGFGLSPSYPGTSLRDDLFALVTQASACADRPHLLRVATEAARSSPALGAVLRARFVAFLQHEIEGIAQRAVEDGNAPLTACELTALTDTTAALLIYVSNSADRAGELARLENLVENVLLVLITGERRRLGSH
ncbi:TetR/AcrR family transcriptional regulator [Uliginosibacterium sp. 31-12]|uniref:TetR/AcrR family transcriptional regulator n=1 Tax=Uliginosibacterium sp. 31-12 TaxID=3062781 RepID=UPI0026E29742|nr:TetR/AcrR family transcriptional regulator [Uliginosibacterium sp. 31-12]MDO6387857.1 TetR/AcrR family transcriptional regulator [Uliginosibacterium sp. 31-12]